MLLSSRHMAAMLTLTVSASVAAPAGATTKGLNQIVTPDVQPVGQLSISGQLQHPGIGNDRELQFEYGITPRLEAAVFQGFDPRVTFGAVELALVQHGPYLLSTGFANWASNGGRPQPFLESGYYKGANHFIAGVTRVAGRQQAILGFAHQATPKLQLSFDYQSGTGNAATMGFTYNLAKHLSLNPAIYLTQGTPRHKYGYAVLTWDVSVKR